MIDGGQGSGVRIMEHRDMATLAYKDFIAIEDKNSFRHMYKFMEETGSIRVSSNGPRLYAEVYQKPTLSQLKTLVKNYNEGGYEFITIDAVVPSKNLFSGIATDRANVQNVFTSDTRVNVAELSKFLDFQAVKGKRFIGIQSMNIQEYSNMSNADFVKKLTKLESNLSNTFGTKDISTPSLEYYINNVINKADYGKYK
jgi:lipopolysaccharide export LptBFGC system permease protein LptF